MLQHGGGLSFIPVLLVVVIDGHGGEANAYIFFTFVPLQGVFNFIAYILPKVRNAKEGPTKRLRLKHGVAGNGNNQCHDLASGISESVHVKRPKENVTTAPCSN